MLKRKLVLILLLALCVCACAGASAAEPEGKSGYSTVAAGDWHSLAIDGQGRLYTWGSNCFGQLGNGKRTSLDYDAIKVVKNADVYTPTRLQLKPEKRFVHVAAGAMHSLALADDGMLYAWGNNYYGQLGIGTQEIQTKPVPVMSGVRYVSACDNTTVAVRTDGTLWIWGQQDPGMYGEPTNIYYIYDAGDPRNFAPRRVASGVVKAVADPTCILYIDEAGQLWGIGRRSYLGVGDQDQRSYETEPVRILANVADVIQGYAVDANGDLYTWGANSYTPTRVMGDVARVFSNKLILKRDGSLWEWGRNVVGWDHYQSDGSSFGGVYFYDNGRTSDEMVRVLDRVRYADSGMHFLAMNADGTLYGWGCNIFGQAGTEKRTKIKYHFYSGDEVGDIYDFYFDAIHDAVLPVKLATLMDVKKSAKVTVSDRLPELGMYSMPEPAPVEPGWEAYAATLNQKMATRSGPGTKFTEAHGTLPQDTEIVAYAQEAGGSTTWVLVEYMRKDGLLVRTYTGRKRVDADFDAIPYATKEPRSAKVIKDSTAYYGPGKAYKKLNQEVGKGTDVLVYGTDMGYALIEYTVDGDWVRSWVSVDFIALQ